MSDWHPSHAARWFAVARSDRLGAKPLGMTVMGQPVVVARLPDGGLIALEDRCPHRQAPLSSGCVTAAGLACPYHGWTFGVGGELRELPGLPTDVPLPAVRARAHAVREHDGLVWLRLGEGGDELPALVCALQPSQRRYLWQSTWPAHVLDAMENFLDPLHTHSVHPGLVRRGGARQPTLAALAATPDGFVVDYRGQGGQSGLLYRLFESRRVSERAWFAAPGSAQIEYRYADGSEVRITLHFTPRTLDSTEVFATLHVAGRWAPAWAVRCFVWPFLRRVGEQDRAMLGLQRANRRRFPGRGDASTALDLVRPALARFWGEGRLPDASLDTQVHLLL